MNNAEVSFRQKRIISQGKRTQDVELLRYTIKNYLGEITREEALAHMGRASYYNYRRKIKDFLNDKGSKLRTAEKNLLLEYRDSLKNATVETPRTSKSITTKTNIFKSCYGLYDFRRSTLSALHSSADYVKGYLQALEEVDSDNRYKYSLVKIQMEILPLPH